jgi:hypothetical protein
MKNLVQYGKNGEMIKSFDELSDNMLGNVYQKPLFIKPFTLPFLLQFAVVAQFAFNY